LNFEFITLRIALIRIENNANFSDIDENTGIVQDGVIIIS